MSLLLLTVTLRGVSNKHCLLPLFSFQLKNCEDVSRRTLRDNERLQQEILELKRQVGKRTDKERL